jgi:hypothetical protein
MSRMLPPEYSEQTVSTAEKRVFNLLKHDPDTGDWVVLHSLGLTSRPSGPYGEIDFVIILPFGAVICLEVKGGRVSCRDGIWQVTDRSGRSEELKKSPFMQARDEMFALRTSIQRKFGKEHPASSCLFGYAVVFPDVPSPPSTPEFEPWEAIGRDDLNVPISKIILRVVSAQRTKFGCAVPRTLAADAGRDICRFLRPDFERLTLRPAAIAETEHSLIALTEDQYYVLDMIADNRRCLIEGAAGTGKTVLALECARRAGETGQRTLLLCFNRLLGDWLSAQSCRLGNSQLKAGSYFHFVRELILSSSFRKEFEQGERRSSTDSLFSELVPLFGSLAAEEAAGQFELIVLDEAQDLLNTSTLDVLGPLLNGGLAGGSWYIFGDFTRQAIYGKLRREECLNDLKARCPHITYTKLVTNCRNTKRIGTETALLSGFPSLPYRLGQVDGLPVDYRYWGTADEQLESLTKVVSGILDEGLRPEDLILLSPRRFSESVASQLACRCKTGTVVASDLRSGLVPQRVTVGFATIQAFKGMESPCIVICDLENIETEDSQALLYVGMSRARSHLVMMVHKGIRERLAGALLRELTKERSS